MTIFEDYIKQVGRRSDSGYRLSSSTQAVYENVLYREIEIFTINSDYSEILKKKTKTEICVINLDTPALRRYILVTPYKDTFLQIIIATRATGEGESYRFSYSGSTVFYQPGMEDFIKINKLTTELSEAFFDILKERKEYRLPALLGMITIKNLS